MKTIKTILAASIFLVMIGIVLIALIYPIYSGIYYWTIGHKKIVGEISPPNSFGKNWCTMVIYQEKWQLKDIPKGCYYLLPK